jgi:hypothetical protein
MDQKANGVEGAWPLSTPDMSQDRVIPVRDACPYIRLVTRGKETA